VSVRTVAVRLFRPLTVCFLAGALGCGLSNSGENALPTVGEPHPGPMSTGGSHHTDREDGHVSLFAAISEGSVAGASDCGDEIGMFTFPGVSPWGSGEIE
jgi:hypothetical protein